MQSAAAGIQITFKELNMEKDIVQKFNDAGIDIESVLNRFMGNEDLLNNFLAKFIETTSFDELKKQINNLDWENAYVTSHHLKGQCANFSFEKLFSLLSDQLNALRTEDYQKATTLLPAIFIEKEKVMRIIRTYLNGEL